jgi:hypothetical protein
MAKSLLAIFLVACFACALRAEAGVGSPAPDFEFVRSWNLSGSQTRLSDFRGTPVLLEAFATW